MDSILEMLLRPNFWFSVIRVTTPILFPAIAALLTDKAGIMNISMEGTMLFSALAGVIISAWTGSAWVGLMGAMSAGLLLSFVLAYFTLELKTDVILGGTAINLFADGGSFYFIYAYRRQRHVRVLAKQGTAQYPYTSYKGHSHTRRYYIGA